MLEFLILIIVILFIMYLLTIIKNKSGKFNYKTISKNRENIYYIQKNIITTNERNFYNKIKILEDRYTIIPQVCLAAIIQKKGDFRYQNELYKLIDFGIFSKDLSKLHLLIEINDQTHNKPNRKKRDFAVKDYCSKAKIPLITFYSSYPNETNYVINRILNEIEKESNSPTSED